MKENLLLRLFKKASKRIEYLLFGHKYLVLCFCLLAYKTLWVI